MYVDEGYVSHQDETQSSVEAGHAESLDGDMHVKSAEEIMRGAVNRDHPVFNLILEVFERSATWIKRQLCHRWHPMWFARRS